MRFFLPLVALLSASCAEMTAPPAAPAPLPASVAVVFDRQGAEAAIVEGLADRATGRAVSANDPVRIASISKLVMTVATMRLVDEGKVALDTDVSRYLAWPLRHPAYPDTAVTLRQLLSHRSGLRDDAGYVVPYGDSLADKLDDPRAWYAEAPPGEAPFEYANLGSPVVATVLEAASGERYDRLLERTVFAPLGVEACVNWVGCSQEFSDSAVVLYRSTGQVARDDAADRPPNCPFPVADGVECSLAEYEIGTNASIFSPQGGVRIGMLDLAKIGQAVFDPENAFLSSTSRDALLRSASAPTRAANPFFCRYGLAIQRIQSNDDNCDDTLIDDGRTYVGHAGEAYGLRSGLWFDLGTGSGIAYFTTGVPDRTAPDEGGFVDEEVDLVRRAFERLRQTGDVPG